MTDMQTSTGPEDGGVTSQPAPGWYTVAKVVFPENRDDDTLPLYVEHGRRTGGAGADEESLTVVATDHDTHGEDVRSRRSTDIPAGSRVSFAAYFNAFPASYWRRWTTVEKVRLSVKLHGEATVLVYRSSPRGTSYRVASQTSANGASLTFDLDLKPFGDGGWYWFDVVSAKRPARLEAAEWQVRSAPVRPGRLSIGVTTLNRTGYCKALVDTVGSAVDLRAQLDKLYIVDQGSQRVEDEPGWAESAAVLGDQLQVIHQDNLGGSGGFSRGMYETVTAGNSDYHMMLDDDVNIEPEGIVRALTFASYCRHPTLVGGHMFDMFNRSVLHAWGEEVDPWPWWWGPVNGLPRGHDFATQGIRETWWLHRRVDVAYNGWWMCLVPTEVIKEIGLALPIFIKWDDAEYGLRAAAAGYPTVTLPGSAVWHISWDDKDDSTDWQAYYHQRNRMLVALLYSPYPHGGSVLAASLQGDAKHAFSMQYYAEELRLRALKDLLAGPERLHRSLGTTLPQLRAIAQQFDDAQYSADPDAFPLPARAKPPRKGRRPSPPRRAMLLPWAAATAVKQIMRPPTQLSRRKPQEVVPHASSKWWLLSQLDSAVVSKADGTAASWYKREPDRFRRQMAESLRLHALLRKNWADLSVQYKGQVSHLTSFQEWAKTFGLDETTRR
jgi:galactofuranosylgalactofuranosylrhamnosyl-N-acetylglucosaminyl-diphospho-decaprenol beta-1,5/1,6-galactofuranosyltransferase